MDIDNGWIICSLLLFPIYTHIIYRSAIHHIYELGKSKTFLKKEKASLPFGKKLSLGAYVENCKHHSSIAKRLVIVYWIQVLFHLLCVLVWATSLCWTLARIMLPYLVLMKSVLFDLPTILFFFLMTKHGKNGGVTWKWEI